MFSYYTNQKSKKPSSVSLEWYTKAIQEGYWQDYVIPVRAEFESNGKSKKYSFLKNQSPIIMGSCLMKAGSKVKENVESLNGFLLVDIDTELSKDQYYAIREDKHTHIMHRSIGGAGYVVFIKIDTSKNWDELFLSVAQYYLDNFSIQIDISCKNKNRHRFISYDPDLFYNPKSSTYRKTIKKKEPKKQDVNYVFTKSDFDNILSQIKERRLDLCREDYFRYVQIGMSLANEFGSQGEDAFHLVCSFGSKYDRDNATRDYKGFCKRANGKSSIGTFYYLCKEEGIDIYSEKTKTIINRVKVSKTQGEPTVKSVVKNLKAANEIEATKEDEELIDKLIKSKVDYSKNANLEITEIEQVERFIVDTYAPYEDLISLVKYINGNTRMTDKENNDIYLQCKKSFDFNINKNDVNSILNSSAVREVDVLADFLEENKHNETGYIEKYASAIHPNNDYNLWAFKKWIVGAIHNWMSDKDEVLVCPLTIVMCGQGHGTGKTSFLRNVVPKELRKYFAEGKIDGKDKDSMFRMSSNLIMFDDEFGGKGLKDVKEYKAYSDSNLITIRRPYKTMDEVYKRRAILCGTSNETDILKDVTGNRRIMPIKVDKIDYDLITSIDTRKMIIEAYNLWKSGFDWKIFKEEDINYLKENTIENNEVLPVEEIFFKYFSLEKDDIYEVTKVVNQGEILNFLLFHTNMRVTKFDIKDIIVKNNLKYRTHRITNGVKKGILLYMKTDLNYED